MIWRRVLAPVSVSLRELHGILQVRMGWECIHLYYFDIHAVHYGAFELDAESPDLPLSAFRERERFAYLYDMGDFWEHEVRIEKFLEREPKKGSTKNSGCDLRSHRVSSEGGHVQRESVPPR